MKDRKIDTIAKIAMRSRGITVKEKRLRFQGEIVVFKYSDGHYDVLADDLKIDAIETNNIHDAIAAWKKKKVKV